MKCEIGKLLHTHVSLVTVDTASMTQIFSPRQLWKPEFMVVIITILKYCEWIIIHVDDGKFRIVIIIKMS